MTKDYFEYKSDTKYFIEYKLDTKYSDTNSVNLLNISYIINK